MNQVTRINCGYTPGGEDICQFILQNTRGTEVMISNYGATIMAFKVKNADGTTNDIVLGFEKTEDYHHPAYLSAYPWFGCAVGRYANRVKGAGFFLNGQKIKLEANQGVNTLHGGYSGFDKKIWETVSFGHFPHQYLELKYASPDGECGFPGNLQTTIRFELTDENELSYTFKAVTDKPTAVNLTHHSYFNLDNGEGTILDHELAVYGNHILEQSADLAATGNLSPVEGTAFDFRSFHSIGSRINEAGEYDKSYVVKEKTFAPSLVAETKSQKSGLRLQVLTTEPIVHFYAGKWIPGITGKRGAKYGAFSGFCLETHVHPNAVNIPGFPDTILMPGEEYYQQTVYKVLS